MPTTHSQQSIVCPIVVGRDDVLAMLDQHIERTCRGQLQILALSGEAGIGKSRLLTEAKARAIRSSMTIFEGRSFESDQSMPFAPILDLLRTFRAEHPEHRQHQLGSTTSNLTWLLPELASTSPVQFPIGETAPVATSPHQRAPDKLTLFESLAHIFLQLAANRPKLLVLEDLHWSDEVSLEFLIYAARRWSTHPIMLLLTYRSDEVNQRLNHLIAMLGRSQVFTDITLTRLTQDQVDLMICKIFGSERHVPVEILDAIYNLTEGNPFFVEEVLKSLVMAGEIFFEDGKWDRKPMGEWNMPRSVQEAVRRRVGRTSERARRVLTIAAVAGRRFDFTLLQEVLGTSEQELLEHLRDLIAAQLVAEESVDRYSFRHALTRLAVYKTLLRRERQKLHHEIAETQERIYAESIMSHLADLSYHFFEGGVWVKALDYASRAGEQAQGIYAPREAIDHFTRAIKSSQALALPSAARLYRARGQAYETVGDMRAASTDYAVALTAAGRTGDALAQWQSLIDLGFLWAARDYSKTGEYFQQALSLARATGDHAALAHSLNRIGNWHTNIGMHLEAIQYHREAEAIFQKLNDRRGLAQTLDLLGLAHLDASDLIQGTAYLERSIALSRELDDRPSLASSLATVTMGGLNYHCDTVVLASKSDDNVKHGQEALKTAREIGWRAGEAYALLELGFSLAPRGKLTDAMQAAQTAIEIAEEIEHNEWLAGALCCLGAVELDLLDLASARSHLERALALANEIGSRIWLPAITGFLAQTYLWDNDAVRAGAILDAALGSARPSQTRAQRLCWCVRAEIALVEGNARRALQIVDELIASAPHVTEQTVIPRLWTLRGRALAAQRHYSKAAHLFQVAQVTAFEQGARPLLWRIHLALGDLYRAQTKRDDSSSQFHLARQIVEELAAHVQDRSMAESFIAHANEWIPRSGQLSPRQSKKNEYSGLTAREREVASLLARGKSNREIAAALTVTERTVAAHVGNILGKLGLTSRTQIAAWAIERGLSHSNKEL